MRDTAAFLRAKLRTVPVSALARAQVEALVVALAGWIPGVPGFAIRSLCYRLLFAKLGGIAWIQPGVTFVETHRLRIGRHFGCNTGSYINALGGIDIGDYVLIGSNVTISAGQHPIEGREPPVFARAALPKRIVIENDVWIGAGAVIMPGITLRQGTVVGSNAVVTRDTEPYSVMAGVPARKIRSRDDVKPG
jgi:maltose O-acetyltransferase